MSVAGAGTEKDLANTKLDQAWSKDCVSKTYISASTDFWEERKASRRTLKSNREIMNDKYGSISFVDLENTVYFSGRLWIKLAKSFRLLTKGRVWVRDSLTLWDTKAGYAFCGASSLPHLPRNAHSSDLSISFGLRSYPGPILFFLFYTPFIKAATWQLSAIWIGLLFPSWLFILLLWSPQTP